MSQRAPDPQVQQPPGTYNAEQGFQLSALAHEARVGNLIAAADHIIQIFQAFGIPYSLMGGFSLKMRGSQRNTYDVDVAIGCEMVQLIEALKTQPRVLRPSGPVSGVMRVFVPTGGQHNPGLNLDEVLTEVDIILRGNLGAPDDPRTASETLNISTNLGPRQYTMLNVAWMTSSKLGAFSARGSRNDFDDVVFLIQNFPEAVVAARPQLSGTHRQYFVREYSRTYPGPANAARVQRVKHVLGVLVDV